MLKLLLRDFMYTKMINGESVIYQKSIYGIILFGYISNIILFLNIMWKSEIIIKHKKVAAKNIWLVNKCQ